MKSNKREGNNTTITGEELYRRFGSPEPDEETHRRGVPWSSLTEERQQFWEHLAGKTREGQEAAQKHEMLRDELLTALADGMRVLLYSVGGMNGGEARAVRDRLSEYSEELKALRGRWYVSAPAGHSETAYTGLPAMLHPWRSHI